MEIREIYDWMTTPCAQCDKPIEFDQVHIKYDMHWTHTFCDTQCFMDFMIENQLVYMCKIKEMD